MNNVTATIGLVQLENIREVIDTYISNGQFYDEALKNVKGVELVDYYLGAEPSYWLYTMKVDDRVGFVKMMADNGIMASELHKRNDAHSIFNLSKTDLPAVDKFSSSMVHIPCGWWVSKEDREYIANCIRKGW